MADAINGKCQMGLEMAPQVDTNGGLFVVEPAPPCPPCDTRSSSLQVTIGHVIDQDRAVKDLLTFDTAVVAS